MGGGWLSPVPHGTNPRGRLTNRGRCIRVLCMETTSAAKPTAQSVSAALRRAGFLPVADRRREGLRCSGIPGQVFVRAALDSASAAQRMADDAREVLAAAGYTIKSGQHVAGFTVTAKEA